MDVCIRDTTMIGTTMLQCDCLDTKISWLSHYGTCNGMILQVLRFHRRVLQYLQHWDGWERRFLKFGVDNTISWNGVVTAVTVLRRLVAVLQLQCWSVAYTTVCGEVYAIGWCMTCKSYIDDLSTGTEFVVGKLPWGWLQPFIADRAIVGLLWELELAIARLQLWICLSGEIWTCISL